MNYLKHYNILIERSKSRKTLDHTERHHIIPKCLGGSDDHANIAVLTTREHYIAHQLLVKIYPSNKGLISALFLMTTGNKNRTKNRTYAWMRKKHSEFMSENQSGKGNSQYGTIWIFNDLSLETKKINKVDKIPEGWRKGRSKIKTLHECEYQKCSSKAATVNSKYCLKHRKIRASESAKKQMETQQPIWITDLTKRCSGESEERRKKNISIARTKTK